MATSETVCGFCGARFRLAREAAGRRLTCSKCGRPIQVGVVNRPSSGGRPVGGAPRILPALRGRWRKLYLVAAVAIAVAVASRLVPGMTGAWIGTVAILTIVVPGAALFFYFVLGAWLANHDFADHAEIWQKRKAALGHGSLLSLIGVLASCTQYGRLDEPPRQPRWAQADEKDKEPSSSAGRKIANKPAIAPPAVAPLPAPRETPVRVTPIKPPSKPAAPPAPVTSPSRLFALPGANPSRPSAPPIPPSTPPLALADTRPAAPTSRPAAALAGVWKAVLPSTRVPRDAVAGPWQADNAAGVVSIGTQTDSTVRKLLLPVAPTGDYSLRVRFVRTAGQKEWCVLLPIGGQPAQVWIGGQSGQSSSLSPHSGSRIDPAASPLVNNIEQELVFEVIGQDADGQSSLNATLDGKPYLAWRGNKGTLTVNARYAMPDATHIGLAVHPASAMEFRDVSAREAKNLEPE